MIPKGEETMNQEMSRVCLYLTSGRKIIATYEDEEYEDIYDIWERQLPRGVLVFHNCCVHAEHVLAIEYL
jgi:hypothetical protein